MERMSLRGAFLSIVAIALPISGNRLLTLFSSFIAMMMVAQLGEQPLAAGFLATISATAIVMFTSSIFYAVSIRIRYFKGQNNPSVVIGRLVKNALYLAIVLAIPSGIIIASMDKLLWVLGLKSELVILTKNYFFYAAWGMFPMLAMMVIGQFYIGIGKSYFTLAIGLISLPLTLALSYGLVLGRLGFPQLGLGGVSLACLIVQSILLISNLVMIGVGKLQQEYRLFMKPFQIDWQLCESLVRLGFPIGTQLGGELIAMALTNYLMGYFGVHALAALQITNQYSMIIVMLSFGLAQAMSSLVSEAFGKQEANFYLIKKYIQASSLILIFFMLPVSFLFCTSPALLAKLYMDTSQLQPEFFLLLPAFFMLSALFLFLDGIRNLLTSILRGLHDTKISTRVNLMAMWFISLPVSMLVVFVFKGGPIALRVGFLSGFIAAVIALTMHLYKKLGYTAHSVRINSVAEHAA